VYNLLYNIVYYKSNARLRKKKKIKNRKCPLDGMIKYNYEFRMFQIFIFIFFEQYRIRCSAVARILLNRATDRRPRIIINHNADNNKDNLIF